MSGSTKVFSSLFLGVALMLSSCLPQTNYKNIPIHETPRWEFAPNMYHSVAYEPLSQIVDEDAGRWVSSIDDGVGEFYNSNPFNPHKMNMREPVPGTVKRNLKGFLPYRLGVDDLTQAQELKNPLPNNEAVLADGKILFAKFCAHCHGDLGDGEGPVNDKLKGVANLRTGQMLNISHGHIFHVITHGKGRMGAHGSQLDQEERWKIAHYVKEVIQNPELAQ